MDLFNIILLLASALLCCFYFVLLGMHKLREEKETSDRVYYLLLSLTVLLALGLRLYGFGSVPAGMNQDGAMAAVDAKALADYGTDRLGMRYPVHLTAWGYGQMSALLSYLMVPFIKLFGLSSVVARLPQLLASLCGLAFFYLFVRDVFGKNAALTALFFAAVSPWHIMQSRWALDCNLFPHFFMAGLFFLNRVVKGKSVFLIMSMAAFGLCMYCYGISLYTVPVFLFAACIYLLATKKLRISQALLSLAVYLLVAWPFFAVMAINYFKLPTVETPLFTLPYFSGSVRSGDILLFSHDIPGQLAANLKSLWEVVVRQRDYLPWNGMDGFGTVYLFSLPFALLGLFELLREKENRCGRVLSLLFFLTGILAGLMTNGININRVNIIFYPLLLLCALGIRRVCGSLRGVKWAVMAAYLAALLLFAGTYFTSHADTMAYYFYADFGAAVSSVKNTDADVLYITADTQYEGSAAVSEILTLFYHETDAKYYQGETPSGETPYADKYRYVSMDASVPDSSENAVYVIRADDLPLFDPQLFTAESFGSYYTVRRIEQ